MAFKTITSATNPLIKSIAKLHDAKERKERRRCIIEGKRALTTAITHLTPDLLFCTEKERHYAHMLTQEDKIIVIPENIMKKLSTATTPSGLLGIFHIPNEPDADLLTPGLVLAQIQDPGNMGTLLRTAVACNVSSVVIIDGCDPWSPKVMQSSAGTIGQLKLFQWSWETLIASKKDLLLYALVVKGGQAPSLVKQDKALLVIGNEAHGIPQEWVSHCDASITLPMPGTTESLNAAIAGSIATYLTFVQQNS